MEEIKTLGDFWAAIDSLLDDDCDTYSIVHEDGKIVRNFLSLPDSTKVLSVRFVGNDCEVTIG